MKVTTTDVIRVIDMADRLLGSEMGKALVGFFKGRPELTPEQKANLDANHDDYTRRIAQLEDEIANDQK